MVYVKSKNYIHEVDTVKEAHRKQNALSKLGISSRVTAIKGA